MRIPMKDIGENRKRESLIPESIDIKFETQKFPGALSE